MDTAKGIVLEKNGAELVLLLPGGEFVKYKLQGINADVGDEILIPVNREKKRISRNKIWLVAAAAVFLALFIPILSNNSYTTTKTVAYLSVDINPSIELALDKNFKVRELKTFNSDGDQIIRETKLKGLDATEAVSEITDQAYKDGFLGQDKENAVVLSLTSVEQSAVPTEIENKLKSSVEKTLANDNLGGVVQTILTTPSIREEAKAEGISPGKYAILLEALKQGLDITPQQLKNASIATVIKNAGGQLGEIVGKAHQEKDFKELSANYKKVKATSADENLTEDNKKDNGQKKDDLNTKKSNGKSKNNTNTKSNINKSSNVTTYPNVNKPVTPKRPTAPYVYKPKAQDN